MALKVAELFAELGVDASQLDKGVDKAVTTASRSMREVVDAAEKAGQDAGEGLADGVAKGTVGLGSDVEQQLRTETSGLDSAAQRIGTDAGDELAQGVERGAQGLGADIEQRLKSETSGLPAAGRKIGEDTGGGIGGGILDGFPDLGGGIGGVLDDALSGLPAAAAGPALAVGAAAGAALVGGLGTALEQGGIESQFEAALGVNESVAADMGEMAGDIYANNFGESMGQVAESMRLVGQNMAGLGDLSEAELQQINEAALTTVNVFDQDLRMTIAAVATMMRTGLAKDSTEAFDIITKGLQGPANKADDLLETFNEYSTMFREIGIDGQESLGLITQAVEAGARDADTAADALKEFAIRGKDGTDATAAGFERIGLNAEDMTRRVAAGGDSAAGALDMTLDRLRDMEDPVQRDAAAVELFGTKAEDLGDALWAMDLDTAVTDLGKVDGAAADAANSFDDLGSQVQGLGRQLKNELGQAFTDGLSPLLAAKNLAEGKGDWETLGKSIAEGVERGLNEVPGSDIIGRWLDSAGIMGNNSVAENVTDWIFGQEIEPPQGLKDVLDDVRQARRDAANAPPLLDLSGIAAQAPAAVASLEDVNREIELSNDLFALAGDRADNYLQRIGNTANIDDQIASQLALRDSSGALFDSLSALEGVDIQGFAAGTVQVSDEAAAALGNISGAASAAQQQIADTLEYQGEGAALEKAGQLRDQFVQMFEAAGMTDQQIIDLLASMGLLPEQVSTAIELSGADEALAKLDLLQTRFEGSIPDKVQTQIDVAVAEGRFVDAANLISMWVKDQEDGSIDDPLLLQIMGETAPAQTAVDEVIEENTGREIWLVLRANVEKLAADMPIFGVEGTPGLGNYQGHGGNLPIPPGGIPAGTPGLPNVGAGSTGPPLPKFHDGGVVPGPLGVEVPIMAQGGEVVLTPAQQAAMGAAAGGSSNPASLDALAAEVRSLATSAARARDVTINAPMTTTASPEENLRLLTLRAEQGLTVSGAH